MQFLVGSFCVVGPQFLSVSASAEALSSSASLRLSKAIQIPTMSQEGEPKRFQDFQRLLRSHYPLVFKTMIRIPVDSESLVLKWSGTNLELKPRLFYAHQDVVPVDPASLGEWSVPPFSGAIQGGFIWGRGALDTKSQLIAMLEAAEELLKKNFIPQRTLYFAFGHDEEVGGVNGARKIAEKFIHDQVRFDSVLDEGLAIVGNVFPGLSQRAAMVGIAQKGYAEVTLIAKGTAGHSSMPRNPTAIERLSLVISEITMRPFSAKITEPVRQMLANFSDNMNGPLKWVLGHLWMTSKIVTWKLLKNPESAALVRTTVATTMISGGVKENVLPSEARATINLRILPGETSQSAVAYVKSLIHDDQVTVVLEPTTVVEPSIVSTSDSQFFMVLKSTILNLWPDTFVTPALVLGQTDSRYFESQSDAIYRFAPLELDTSDLIRIHGVDERVSVANFQKMIKFFEGLFSAP